ncbi:unnamed protein product [Rotaria sordida]|uniref:Uncharacterized protein n=1 Tax=Rotaria sordida TaxID=392033 RepID=A0A814SJ46_9BILA|nr:unnamed protein product [Rotaria sordida]CAF1385277.1 unnamed protein product [Rotaria sordida]
MSVPGSKPDFITDDECYINCPNKRTAYEWHLNDRNDFALKKAKKFRLQYEKLYVARHWLITVLLRLNTTVKDLVYAILKGYLNDVNMPADRNIWEDIIQDLKTAGAENEPTYILRAYSRSQTFSKRINNDMAKNTYHELKLYCTSLNCNVLARTQDASRTSVCSPVILITAVTITTMSYLRILTFLVTISIVTSADVVVSISTKAPDSSFYPYISHPSQPQ